MFYWTCVCVKWKRSWKNWSRVEKKTRDSSSSAFPKLRPPFFGNLILLFAMRDDCDRKRLPISFSLSFHARLNWLSCQKHLLGWFFIENDDEEGRDEWNSIENGKSMKRNWEFVKWWIKNVPRDFFFFVLKRFRYNFISFSLHLTASTWKVIFLLANVYTKTTSTMRRWKLFIFNNIHK